jgi:hypothetical membrane protein
MKNSSAAATSHRFHPELVEVLSRFALLGSFLFVASVVIADFLVPQHDWIADTISDLGAGRHEFIVDIGLYAFSAALISLGLIAAHMHLGGTRWSLATVGLVLLGLVVFLVGARNEYGDGDDEGVVIHIYLVYAIGVLVAAIPLLMCAGARRVSARYPRYLVTISVVWTVSAPIFFFLPTDMDGLYERGLGLIVLGLVYVLTQMFLEARDVLEQ